MTKYRLMSLVPVLAVVLLLGACSSLRERPTRVQEIPAPMTPGNRPIKVESIRLAASGLMIDLRYRVVDRKQAKLLLDRKTSITLTDQKTGAILGIPSTPKVGKLRQVPADDDPARIYWIFFTNTGGVVRPGTKVALSVGDMRINDLVVQ